MKLMPGLGVLCQLFTSGCPLSEYFGQSCQTHSSNDIYLTYFPSNFSSSIWRRFEFLLQKTRHFLGFLKMLLKKIYCSLLKILSI